VTDLDDRRVVPLAPTLGVALGRAVRLRCPACGTTALFDGPFRMRAHCATCGLVFEREPGYFIGAIYINYGITAVLALGVVLLLDWTIGLPLWSQLAIGLTIAVVSPLAFFRHARSLWLGVEYFVTQADQRQEARRWRRPKVG
jgi:uncharacterized protein (DUF983 family)